MLLQAAEDHEIDLRQSWMVGDGLNDIQAGRAAGCKTILVTKLKLDQVERFFDLAGGEPDVIVSRLSEALKVIQDSP